MKNLIIEIFETKMSLERIQEINEMYHENSTKAALIRDVQILSDSIRICLSSKNENTAFSRFDLLNRVFERVSNSSGLDEDVLGYVNEKVENAKKKFETIVYLNLAEGYKEKSLKMKSSKGKLKYLNLAESILKKGLLASESDKEILNSALQKVLEEKHSLAVVI